MVSSHEEALKRIEQELAAIRRELGGKTQHRPGWMTFREVAEELRISPRSVARLVRSGVLVTVRVGSAPRILRAELERLKVKRAPSMGEGRPVRRPKARGATEAERIRALAKLTYTSGPPSARCRT